MLLLTSSGYWVFHMLIIKKRQIGIEWCAHRTAATFSLTGDSKGQGQQCNVKDEHVYIDPQPNEVLYNYREPGLGVVASVVRLPTGRTHFAAEMSTTFKIEQRWHMD